MVAKCKFNLQLSYIFVHSKRDVQQENPEISFAFLIIVWYIETQRSISVEVIVTLVDFVVLQVLLLVKRALSPLNQSLHVSGTQNMSWRSWNENSPCQQFWLKTEQCVKYVITFENFVWNSVLKMKIRLNLVHFFIIYLWRSRGSAALIGNIFDSSHDCMTNLA